MEDRRTIAVDDGATIGSPAGPEEEAGPCLEHLQAIETGCGPKFDSGLLMDLLTPSSGLVRGLADPMEAHSSPEALANIHAYKHRLHALRCEYADARLRALEMEEQLAEARLQILRLEARVKHLDTTLDQIYASRFWKVKERCARWWRRISR